MFHEYFLNPCDHDYIIHFDRTKSAWIPKTLVEKWNIEKLRLNSIKQLHVRDSRAFFKNRINELSERKEHFEKALINNKLSSFKEIINEIEGLDRRINFYKFKILNPLD